MGAMMRADRRRMIGVGTVLAALVFVLASHDVSTQSDVRVDLSLGRLDAPGDAVRSAVAELAAPTDALLFFPPRDPIAARLEPWLDQLSAESDQLTVRRVDAARQPELARRHGVEGDGVLVLAPEGTEGAALVFGDRPALARRVLRRLDSAFLQTLGEALAPPRPVYFVQGHGEPSLRETPRSLTQLLERSGYELRTLDLRRLPGEAGDELVVLFDPRAPLEESEVDALGRFVARGGRVLVAVEDASVAASFAPLGVRGRPGLLRGIDGRARVRSRPSAAHPITAAMTEAVWVDGAIAFERADERAVAPLRVERAFRDVDGDGRRGEDEAVETQAVVVATRGIARGGGGEGRVVVIGDADLLGDASLQRPAGATFVRDTLGWLAERAGGRVAPPIATTDAELEVDHASGEARVVYLLAIFGVPLPFFALAIGTRRRHS